MLEQERTNPAEEPEFCFLQQYAVTPSPTYSNTSPVCEPAAAESAAAAHLGAAYHPAPATSNRPSEVDSGSNEKRLAAGSKRELIDLTEQQFEQRGLAGLEQQAAQEEQEKQQNHQQLSQEQEQQQQLSHEASQLQQSKQQQQQQEQWHQWKHPQQMQHEEPGACSDGHAAKRQRSQMHQTHVQMCGKGKKQGGTGLAESHMSDSHGVAASKLQQLPEGAVQLPQQLDLQPPPQLPQQLPQQLSQQPPSQSSQQTSQVQSQQPAGVVWQQPLSAILQQQPQQQKQKYLMHTAAEKLACQLHKPTQAGRDKAIAPLVAAFGSKPHVPLKLPLSSKMATAIATSQMQQQQQPCGVKTTYIVTIPGTP